MPSIQIEVEDDMIETMEQEPVYVTRPSMPPLDDFVVHLERIWENRWLTNNGEFHKRLEAELAEFLGVKYVSLFSNGTLALLVALQAMRVSGEVITTPYTFVATTHALHWNEITPVFCDIDPKTYNLDPACIESLITPQTSAILPVHVYGYPCDVKEISRIADIYGLKVIYDACHAFNVRVGNESVLNFGDLSVLSFHATKIFTTLEGGAIITNDAKLKTRIDYLKNFGIANETTVMAPGINGKMNEVQAAFGLLQLQYVEENIQKRKQITDRYRTQLAGISGLTFLDDIPDVQHNYSYFPIFIDEEKFGFSRDNVFDVFREKNIICRRYFYPLISHFSMYRNLPSAKHLPAAEIAAAQIICLPLYPDLELSVVDQICDVIQRFESLRDELALVA